MDLKSFIDEEAKKNELIKTAILKCNEDSNYRDILLAFIKNNHTHYEFNLDVRKDDFEYKLAAFYITGGEFKELLELGIWKNIGLNYQFDELLMPILEVDEQSVLCQLFYQEHYGASILDQMLFDKTINEVGFTDSFFYVWSEKKIRIPFKKESKELKTLILRLSENLDKKGLSESNPCISFERKDGSRVSASQPPFSRQLNLSIRLFNKRGDSFDSLHKEEVLNQLLVYLVRNNSKIIFQGELGVGKTTTMQSIYQLIPDNIHIATIEDSFEQNNGSLYKDKRILEFQTLKDMTYFDAIQMILRTSVDFANIGEIRIPDSAKAAVDLSMAISQAMYATLHAVSPEKTVPRLVNLLMMTSFYKNETSAALDVISSFDYIIQHGWKNGVRSILSITEINPIEYEKITIESLDDKEHLEKLYLINQIQSNYRNQYELRTIFNENGIVAKPRREVLEINEELFKEIFAV
ncbi:MAG: ATPase, T2SS/T4P/T4SS family [Nanoarchaeota archaeon]|nr:ATPase, T2SS/T4P/T4SS family [Nanoarchaeota archaeon]